VALLQLWINIMEPSRTRRGGAEESTTLGKEREGGVTGIGYCLKMVLYLREQGIGGEGFVKKPSRCSSSCLKT
jgi:hypothetical protein